MKVLKNFLFISNIFRILIITKKYIIIDIQTNISIYTE